MRKVSGFTLVELLVVIAIMIIIMGFSVPLFSKLSFGNAVDGASRMISSQLSLARAEAVAKRQYIAIIMPGATYTPDSGDDNEYHYKAFRAAIVTPIAGNPNRFNFDSWFPGTEWGFLPNGAVIAEVDGDADSTSSSNSVECVITDSDDDGEIDSRVINESWLGNDRVLHSAGFSNDNVPTIVDDNGASGHSMVSGITNNGVRAIVFEPNGHVAGGTRYVTIVEGVAAESGSTDNLVNGNIHNMRLMRVGHLTGKVTYAEEF